MELKNPALSEKGYEEFLSSPSSDKWKRLGARRRAGVCTPLFSLYSKKSTGIGEITDLKLLVNWAQKTGMSLVMLLPMNDVGYDFRPYDAQSTFALEPMYLNLSILKGVDPEAFTKELKEIKKRFQTGRGRIDYGIKKAKLELLWKQYQSCRGNFPDDFAAYRKKNKFWLEDYTCFRVLKEKFPENTWESWEEPYKGKNDSVMAKLKKEEEERILFHAWVQWQLFEQFDEIKSYAASRGIYFIGDLPFLVSRDSADVWANQNYFKLDRVSGAPPDAYQADGQRWGMPPYRWPQIAEKGYDYLVEKLRYAENFYDMFRIDHFVGLFRLWTIDVHEPYENAGKNGAFDPRNEDEWEQHGRNLLDAMLRSTKMLPCAEDLGVVPPCSYKLLNEYYLPGMDVQRWQRAWDSGGHFLKPSEYRKNSAAVISSHDMPIFLAWWLCEAGTADEGNVRGFFAKSGLDFESLRPLLFETPAFGRLRWKQEITEPHHIAERLGRDASGLHELIAIFESTAKEKAKFLDFAGLSPAEGENPLTVAKRALLKAGESTSIFSIQLIHDWLATAGYFLNDPWNARINFPGTMGGQNWSFVLPLSLEELNKLSANDEIQSINHQSNRI